MNRSYVAGQNFLLNQPKKKTKKSPKNAFSFYLDYLVKELRQEGQNIANKSEAVPFANERWKDLTREEKAPYEQKAKDWKQSQKQQPRTGRLDCTGQLIDSRVDMENFTENQRKQARKLIRSEWPVGKAICDVHFYLISFQSLFELPDEEGYQPCEIACVDYTLNQGIVRVWHQFIDPGPIKLGMRAEIRLFGEKTHRIPEEGFELASGLYHIIWDELLHFIKPDKSSSNFPPIFCKMSEIRKTLFCLDWLSANAGVGNKLGKVFEVEDMAAELYAHGGMMRPSLSIIEDGCNSHMYDYEGNTTCEYHEELECVHCAVLTVKKCCYWMSDSLAKVYGFEITDQHLPVRKPPSFIITKPDMVPLDDRPRHNRDNSSRSRPLNQSGFDGSGSGYGARDIRYRGNYDVVPSRKNCTDIEPSSSSLTSNLCTGAARVGEPADVQPNYFMSGNTPSMGSGTRRPMAGPNYMSQQQQSRSRLAANFQVKPKSVEQQSSGRLNEAATGDAIDQLSEDFDAASISSVTSSEPEFVTVTRRLPKHMLGRGRGRGKK